MVETCIYPEMRKMGLLLMCSVQLIKSSSNIVDSEKIPGTMIKKCFRFSISYHTEAATVANSQSTKIKKKLFYDEIFPFFWKLNFGNDV